MSEMTVIPISRQINDVPEWVHLLPAGQFPAVSGSKTLRADDLPSIINASMRGGKIVLDENHSTDLAAPRGKSAPAMGWIIEMQVRSDGIWGRVEWTRRGRSAMADRAYRAISPVLASRPDGGVTKILRAALTNNPDLTLETLHSQPIKEDALTYPLSALRSRLGLATDANEAAINAALDAAQSHITLHAKAAQLAGLNPEASDNDILARLKAQQEQVTLHSASEQKLQAQINDLKAVNSQMAGERFVEDAGRQKIISAELREQLITLHTSNPEIAKTVVASLPEAPVSTVTTLHGAVSGKAQGPATKTLSAIDAMLGLTEGDLRTGGLI